jgi:hypothetical protein
MRGEKCVGKRLVAREDRAGAGRQRIEVLKRKHGEPLGDDRAGPVHDVTRPLDPVADPG